MPWFPATKPFATSTRCVLPADLPVEQPTGFELAVNFKAAKQRNVTIPYIVMLRATDVIE